MENAEELVNQTLVIVKRLESKANMFSNSMLVISLLDVIFGLLAIFCTSLTLTALFASATSLTAVTIFGRVIQITKIRQLEKSLRVMNLVSIAWFVNKYKKYLKERKPKMTKSTVLQKVLTTIMAIFGVGGIVVTCLPQFASVAQLITTIIGCCSEGIAVISGIWLSQTSDKVLSQEECEAIKKAREDKINAKELQKAIAIVEEYENAKAIVEKNK